MVFFRLYALRVTESALTEVLRKQRALPSVARVHRDEQNPLIFEQFLQNWLALDHRLDALGWRVHDRQQSLRNVKGRPVVAEQRLPGQTYLQVAPISLDHADTAEHVMSDLVARPKAVVIDGRE